MEQPIPVKADGSATVQKAVIAVAALMIVPTVFIVPGRVAKRVTPDVFLSVTGAVVAGFLVVVIITTALRALYLARRRARLRRSGGYARAEVLAQRKTGRKSPGKGKYALEYALTLRVTLPSGTSRMNELRIMLMPEDVPEHAPGTLLQALVDPDDPTVLMLERS